MMKVGLWVAVVAALLYGMTFLTAGRAAKPWAGGPHATDEGVPSPVRTAQAPTWTDVPVRQGAPAAGSEAPAEAPQTVAPAARPPGVRHEAARRRHAKARRSREPIQFRLAERASVQ